MALSSRAAAYVDFALAVTLCLITGLPLGWIVAMFLAPLLWHLEPILHMELAGHSGPSNGIFYLVWAIVVPTLFGLFFWKLRARRHASRGIESPTVH